MLLNGQSRTHGSILSINFVLCSSMLWGDGFPAWIWVQNNCSFPVTGSCYYCDSHPGYTVLAPCVTACINSNTPQKHWIWSAKIYENPLLGSLMLLVAAVINIGAIFFSYSVSLLFYYYVLFTFCTALWSVITVLYKYILLIYLHHKLNFCELVVHVIY